MVSYVVDVSASMGGLVSNDTNNRFKKIALANTLVHMHVTQKMSVSKSTEFSVLTSGDDTTDNFLNRTVGGYENINHISDMRTGNAGMVSEIYNGINLGSGTGDIISGILCGCDIVMKNKPNLKYTRVLIVVTDGETAVDADGLGDLEHVLSQMQSVGCILSVVLIGSSNSPSASRIKVENVKWLKSCADETGGNYIEVEDVNDVYQFISTGNGFSSRSSLSNIFFELSPEVRFPCNYYLKISKAKLPSLKKMTRQYRTTDATANPGEFDESSVPYDLVKVDRILRDSANPDEELSSDATVRGYKYGNQYVPVGKDEEDEMKIKSPEAVIKVLGFFHASKVPRHHFIGPSMVLQGAAHVPSSQPAISALWKALTETEQVCLVRLVKRANADPSLAVLIPSPDPDESETIIMQQLPCADDVRDFAFPSLSRANSRESTTETVTKKRKSVSAYIDSITIPAPGALQPSILSPINPTHYSVFEWSSKVFIGKKSSTVAPSMEKSPFINRTTTPLAVDCLKVLSTQFDLQPVEKSSKKKKKYYFDDDSK